MSLSNLVQYLLCPGLWSLEEVESHRNNSNTISKPSVRLAYNCKCVFLKKIFLLFGFSLFSTKELIFSTFRSLQLVKQANIHQNWSNNRNHPASLLAWHFSSTQQLILVLDSHITVRELTTGIPLWVEECALIFHTWSF